MMPMPLADAQQVIITHLQPLAGISVDLAGASGRILVRDFFSRQPKPAYSQATRDGFAIGKPVPASSGDAFFFRLTRTLPAGSLETTRVRPGEAVRIMTGALVPQGCERVLPLEICQERGDILAVEGSVLSSATCIREKGCDWKPGHLLASGGEPLTPDHLLILAEDGYTEVVVHRRPKVAVLCTGSELVTPGTVCRPGQKVSGNGVLLATLIRECGGHCFYKAMAVDEPEALFDVLAGLIDARPDVVITTGGMGPGQFDLLEAVVQRLQGTMLYQGLALRPGKATMFGFVRKVPLFALPGPPPAVHLLFHELVAPALRRLQGYANPLPTRVTARLQAPLTLPERGRSSSLRGSRVIVRDGRLEVFAVSKNQVINSVMYIAGGREKLAAGEPVAVDLIRAF